MKEKKAIKELEELAGGGDVPFQSSKIEVTSPSGSKIFLMTYDEKAYYEDVTSRYLQDNKFTNISDLQELDRILVMETMCFRWSRWILEEKDYFGDVVDVIATQRFLDTYSKEIRGLKKDLGIDKSTREKNHGDDIATYIQNLGLRAKAFGIMRNKQFIGAITLLKDISSKLTLLQNYDETEKKEFKWDKDAFIEWLVEKIAEFDKIDEEFRTTEQKLWVRDQ